MSIRELSDADLILRAKELQQGTDSYEDVAGQYLNEIFNRYYSQGYNIARYYGLSREDAADAVQEAFIKAFKSLGSFDTGKEFKPWFFKIVLNAVRDHYRLSSRHRHSDLEEAQEVSEEIFKEFHIRQHINGIISSLPPNLKSVVVLRNYGELSYEEISRTLGVSIRQLHNRINQAYELIRQQVEEVQL